MGREKLSWNLFGRKRGIHPPAFSDSLLLTAHAHLFARRRFYTAYMSVLDDWRSDALVRALLFQPMATPWENRPKKRIRPERAP
jgi:hypothetical protein